MISKGIAQVVVQAAEAKISVDGVAAELFGEVLVQDFPVVGFIGIGLEEVVDVVGDLLKLEIQLRISEIGFVGVVESDIKNRAPLMLNRVIGDGELKRLGC